mmetsp:Transcript_6686/g.11915  ORF Transcript_6686/g.11915 Transcript_6686/m.11915 type:complete len:206 (+) Transcript_6686:227-844(+)
MGRNFNPPSSRAPSNDKKCKTWSPNPPMLPSSTVIMFPLSFANSRIRSMSSGFINRASATVTARSGSISSTSSAAMRASERRVPKERMATRSSLLWPRRPAPNLESELPLAVISSDMARTPPGRRMMRPFPISIGVPLAGISPFSKSYPNNSCNFSGPYPTPLGYLNTIGPLSNSAHVITIFLSSISSLGLMIVKFGIHPKYAKS